MGQISTRSIRTFVLRQGRLTEGQQRSLDLHWQTYGLVPGDTRIDFDTCFERRAPIWMEVGFGNGAALAHMAEHNADVNFVGVEVHLPGVGHALGELAKRDLVNVRVVRFDVLDLIEHHLPMGVIDRLLVYFPDPWHKTRHHKRRMVNTKFLDMLQRLLAPGGCMHFATDWQPYARQVSVLVEQHPGFSLLPEGDAAQAITSLRPQTHFERRGLRLGHKVSDLVVQKVSSP